MMTDEETKRHMEVLDAYNRLIKKMRQAAPKFSQYSGNVLGLQAFNADSKDIDDDIKRLEQEKIAYEIYIQRLRSF